MRKFNMNLTSMVTLLLAGLAASSAHAADWSVTKTVAPYTLRVTANSCFDVPDKMKVGFDWTKSLVGYDSINAVLECGCGQWLELNGKIKISPDSLIELVSNDFPLELSSYTCKSE